VKCQFSAVKGQRSRSPDVKKFKTLPHMWRTCLVKDGGSSASGSGADCKLGLTIVMRPSLGRITHLARAAVCLSVYSPAWAHKSKKRRKIEISINVSHGTSGVPIFSLKRSLVKVTGGQKPQEIAAYLAYMFTYGQRLQTIGLTHC